MYVLYFYVGQNYIFNTAEIWTRLKLVLILEKQCHYYCIIAIFPTLELSGCHESGMIKKKGR